MRVVMTPRDLAFAIAMRDSLKFTDCGEPSLRLRGVAQVLRALGMSSEPVDDGNIYFSLAWAIEFLSDAAEGMAGLMGDPSPAARSLYSLVPSAPAKAVQS
jgi:hypothetical protein